MYIYIYIYAYTYTYICIYICIGMGWKGGTHDRHNQRTPLSQRLCHHKVDWLQALTHLCISRIENWKWKRWVLSRIIESCQIRTSHVTYSPNALPHTHRKLEVTMVVEAVSFHIWMGHVTYEWVTLRRNDVCHMRIRHFTEEYFMSCRNEAHRNESLSPRNEYYHMGMSHVTQECVKLHMIKSCHIVKSHVT